MQKFSKQNPRQAVFNWPLHLYTGRAFHWKHDKNFADLIVFILEFGGVLCLVCWGWAHHQSSPVATGLYPRTSYLLFVCFSVCII